MQRALAFFDFIFEQRLQFAIEIKLSVNKIKIVVIFRGGFCSYITKEYSIVTDTEKK